MVSHYIFVSPIILLDDFNNNANELSLHFYEVYEKLAKKYHPDYLHDAKTLISPSFDKVHFKEEDHYILAQALSKILK